MAVLSDFGAISYAVVAGLYALLLILLVVSWRGRAVGGLLMLACLVSAIWAGMLAAQLAGTAQSPLLLFILEVLRIGAWLTFVGRLLKEVQVATGIRLLAHLIWTLLLLAGIAIWLGNLYAGWAVSIGTALFPGGLLAALVGLVLIEQLYRNSVGGTRWGLKALVLGVGGIFAYDLFLYSQALMFRSLDPTSWVARGAINILFVPLIAIAARRNPDWTLRIFVSRQVVFYSTTLIAAGLYLLLMSAGGYLLLRYGGSWGPVARLIFFAGAAIVLVTLLFSATLRARLKVFLNKHFFHNRYDHREEWLRLVSTLAEFEDSSTRQVVIKAMAQIVRSPGGLLWVLDDDGNRYRQAASFETDIQSVDIETSDPIVEFVTKDGWIIDLEEYARDHRHYGDLRLPDWLQSIPQAWLIVPLTTRQELLGMILLFKAPGPPRLNYEDRDLLKTVATHIAVHLAQERSDNQLSEARQFEAYNRLTAFLMHDLNNLIAQQSLIVSNAEKHKRNPAFVDDAIETISNSVNRMQGVMDQLKRGSRKRSTSTTNLVDAVENAVDQCRSNIPVPVFEKNGVDASIRLDATQFIMVLSHLIRNAQEATAAEGSVTVSLDKFDGRVMIRVEDTGAGMTQTFMRERLFRPFDSTKGSQGMGIGVYQAREFARALGGELRIDSEVAKGTTATMTLPLKQ